MADTNKTSIVSARTGVGAGFGALVGMFALGGPVGGAIGLLLGGSLAHTAMAKKPDGVLTARRHLIFQRAMESVQDPNELRKLAASFDEANLKDYATLLRKRADLRNLPDDVQAKRRIYFRKGMSSDNPTAIRNLAMAFAREGAIDAGKKLKEHADAVEAAHAAGKSAKPQDPRVLEQFADKLARAVAHFGQTSAQAASAARNLLNAQGKQASKDNVDQLLLLATRVLTQEAQAAQAANTPDGEIADASGKVDEDDQPRAQVKPPPDPTGAAEPVVIGPDAPPVEPLTTEQAKSDVGVDPAADEIVVEEAAVEEAATEEKEEKARVRVASR